MIGKSKSWFITFCGEESTSIQIACELVSKCARKMIEKGDS